jgi:hypothetical protein
MRRKGLSSSSGALTRSVIRQRNQGYPRRNDRRATCTGTQPLPETVGGRGRGIGAAAVIVDAAELPGADSAFVSSATVVSWATDVWGYPVSTTREVTTAGDSVDGDNWFANDAAPSTTTTMARNGKNSQGSRLRSRLVGSGLAAFAGRFFEIGFASTSTEYISVLHRSPRCRSPCLGNKFPTP